VPIAAALTEEEEHELETLLNERDELEASEGDAETEKRLSALTQRIAELEAKAPAFAPEDVRIAGCFLSLDSDGRLCIERGYVRPEDEPRSSEEPEAAEPHESASGREQETDWRPVPAATPVEDRDDDSAALPEKLIADLTTFRTLALRDALANDPDTALLALLHTLSLKLL
jgi:ParB family chromosome partitioning protein